MEGTADIVCHRLFFPSAKKIAGKRVAIFADICYTVYRMHTVGGMQA